MRVLLAGTVQRDGGARILDDRIVTRRRGSSAAARRPHAVQWLGPPLALLLGGGFVGFVLLLAGNVNVISCRLTGKVSECVVQDLTLGLYERARRSVVGADRFALGSERYRSTDDDGSEVWRVQHRLEFRDAGDHEVDRLDLHGDHALAVAAAWIDRVDAHRQRGDDSLLRVWFANPPALIVVLAMWVVITSVLLTLTGRQRRWVGRLTFVLAVLQILLGLALVVVLLTRDEPPRAWPGLALPGLLPSSES